MQIYRIYIDKEGYTALGYGPAGARWNKAFTPVIYASSQVSLSMLEHLSIRGASVSKLNWKLATLELDVTPHFVNVTDLPGDWDFRPHPRSTQEIGSRWALQRQSLALAVPSARLPLSRFPKEYNLLINPFHPEFLEKIRLVSEEDVPFQLNY
ncbi:RES family NAD+ phosphorylase [Leeuwenhoekiella parthenopeia]|uniref:RES family NAD+ phosphorylase n=1 Tax=Leeuwenhoekiella parthenopeia TaxID=2890320 RepID=A0ABS8GNA3_9FLAO|nr:RES family NAD+ phosphorylase [Leeuwenhoekiella parthenopeia]MCC4211440.1 RES family NAD+ phosphorylase [Leeuwenhoekiella parthenopeia]